MASFTEILTCNKCQIIDLVIPVSNFYHLTVTVLATGGSVRCFVNLFVDLAFEGLHEAMRVWMIVNWALLTRVPAEKHEVIMTFVQKCSRVP